MLPEPCSTAPPSTRPRILFVDDEQELLDGLRLVLHRMRRAWDVRFALGGAEALRSLAEGGFAVVVTDIRMPGMDGATLLQEVRARHPHVARLVLSGQCDEATARRATHAAHRWIAKPCEPSALIEALRRALEARERLCTPAMQAWVVPLHGLPAPDVAVLQLAERLADPGADASEVAALIARDPAMTARVLQLASSAFFGASAPVLDVHEAVMRLGLTTLTRLLVERELVSELGARVPQRELEAVQRRARCVSRVAGEVLRGTAAARVAAMAGLLAEVGRLALAVVDAAGVEAVTAVAAKGAPRTSAERERLGVSHEVVGAALLALWGLPAAVSDAVLFHEAPASTGSAALDAAVAVHVAAALVDEASGSSGGTALDHPTLAAAGATEKVDAWRRAAAESVAQEARAAEGHAA